MFFLVGIVFLIAASVFVTDKYQPRCAYSEANRAQHEQHDQAAFPLCGLGSHPNTPHTENNIQQGKNDIHWWYILIAWPQGVTALAIIATLFVIGLQAIETRRAAEAALLNAQAVINAERAWLVVSVIDEFAVVPEGDGAHARAATLEENNRRAKDSYLTTNRGQSPVFYISFLNQGKTPAKVIGGESTYCFIDDPKNLSVPVQYSGIFRMPDNTFIAMRDSFKIDPGFDLDAMWEQAEERKTLKPTDHFLVLYGRIIYEDVFAFGSEKERVRHETGWCYCCMAGPNKELSPCGPREYRQNT